MRVFRRLESSRVKPLLFAVVVATLLIGGFSVVSGGVYLFAYLLSGATNLAGEVTVLLGLSWLVLVMLVYGSLVREKAEDSESKPQG